MDRASVQTVKNRINDYRKTGSWLEECAYYADLKESGWTTDQIMDVSGYGRTSAQNKLRVGKIARDVLSFTQRNGIPGNELLAYRAVLELSPLYSSHSTRQSFYEAIKLSASKQLGTEKERRDYVKKAMDKYGTENVAEQLVQLRERDNWLGECALLFSASSEMDETELIGLSGYGADALADRIRAGSVAGQIQAYLGDGIGNISLSTVTDLWPLLKLDVVHQKTFYDALELASRGVMRNEKERKAYVDGIISFVEKDRLHLNGIETRIQQILEELATIPKGASEERLVRLEKALQDSKTISVDDAIERVNISGNEFMQRLAHLSTHLYTLISDEQNEILKGYLSNLTQRLRLYVRRMYGDDPKDRQDDEKSENLELPSVD
ncbi:MAG: hypothetical protein HY519_02475 [Candidatus Aenigmarchaeota archaeon]|nr:hypothetical protein [Candidatus Aenigmarchaeota archaeon]